MTENPYYQYFIGLPGHQEEPPIYASTLVLFRKRLKIDVIMEANEYMLKAFEVKESSDKKDDDYTNPPSGGAGNGEQKAELEDESENVITDEAYRKRGLASACLDYAKQIALKENCYKMMLLTGSKKESTLQFYEQAGYNKNDKTAFIQWESMSIPNA